MWCPLYSFSFSVDVLFSRVFRIFFFECGFLKFHSSVCKCWIFLLSPFGILYTLSVWSYLSSLILRTLSPLILQIFSSLHFLFYFFLLFHDSNFLDTGASTSFLTILLYFLFLNLPLFSFWRHLIWYSNSLIHSLAVSI